jgi:Na+-driven multidrug efflux pump
MIYDAAMRRMLVTTATAITALALSAPAAMAELSGEGKYGEIDDAIVTKFWFYVIFLLPVFLLVMSLAQHKLEKRKYARRAAQKGSDERFSGGW